MKFKIPYLKKLESKYHNKNIEFVSISVDDDRRSGTMEKAHAAWKKWSLKKSMYDGTRDVASNWVRDWQEQVKSWRFQLGLSSKNLFRQESHQVSGMTHGDDFVFTGPTERLTEFENKMTGVYPIKAKIISYGSPESRQAEQKVTLGKARNCLSARSQTCRRACERPWT